MDLGIDLFSSVLNIRLENETETRTVRSRPENSLVPARNSDQPNKSSGEKHQFELSEVANSCSSNEEVFTIDQINQEAEAVRIVLGSKPTGSSDRFWVRNDDSYRIMDVIRSPSGEGVTVSNSGPGNFNTAGIFCMQYSPDPDFDTGTDYVGRVLRKPN